MTAQMNEYELDKSILNECIKAIANMGDAFDLSDFARKLTTKHFDKWVFGDKSEYSNFFYEMTYGVFNDFDTIFEYVVDDCETAEEVFDAVTQQLEYEFDTGMVTNSDWIFNVLDCIMESFVIDGLVYVATAKLMLDNGISLESEDDDEDDYVESDSVKKRVHSPSCKCASCSAKRKSAKRKSAPKKRKC